MDPTICAAVPFALSAAIALALHPRNVPTPWREGLAMGAVNAAIPALLFNIGFSQLPASLVTLTLALAPIFTAVTAHLAFRDDRFSAAKLAGLGISFGGVAFLAGLPAGSGSRSALAFAATSDWRRPLRCVTGMGAKDGDQARANDRACSYADRRGSGDRHRSEFHRTSTLEFGRGYL